MPNFPRRKAGETEQELQDRIILFREAERRRQKQRRKKNSEMRKHSKDVLLQELLYELEQGPYAAGPEGTPEIREHRLLALTSQNGSIMKLHGEVICLYGQLYFLRYKQGLPGLCSNLMTTVNWKEPLDRCLAEADALDAIFLDSQYCELIPRVQLLRKYFKEKAQATGSITQVDVSVTYSHN